MHSLITHIHIHTHTVPLEMSSSHKQIYKHHPGTTEGRVERFLINNLNANWKLIVLDILMGKTEYKHVITLYQQCPSNFLQTLIIVFIWCTAFAVLCL